MPEDAFGGGSGLPPKMEGVLGRTPPQPDPDTTNPPVGQRPKGASGRVSVSGFISWDELNPKLTGVQGLQVFDEMWREDADVKRNLLAAWSPIQTASWSIVPYGGDSATEKDIFAADLSKWALWQFMKPNFYGHLEEVGPLLLRSGYINFEQLWASVKYKGKTVIVPKKLDLRLPKTIWKWFEDEYGYLTGLTQFLPQRAEIYIDGNALTNYRIQPEGNNWIGTSMLRHCYKNWYIKSRLERIDAIGEERKAVGFPIIYPAQNADTETKEEVETVVANAHTNPVSYIMMPGPKAGTIKDDNIGWLVDVIQFDSSSGKSCKESIEIHSQKIASAFLADFLELGHHQVGARATAQVQEDPFLTAVAALGGSVKHPLDELIERISFLNVPGIEGPPSLQMSVKDQTSISEIAEFVAKLVKEGVLTPDAQLERYMRERGNLPPHDPTTATERSPKEEKEIILLPAANAPKENPPKRRKLKPNANKAPSANKDAYQEEGDENTITNNVTSLDIAQDNESYQQGIKDKLANKPLLNETEFLDTHKNADDDDYPLYQAGYKADSEDLKLVKHDLDSPTLEEDIKWYEELVDQGRLKEAIDGAREALIKSATPAAAQLALQAAARAQVGRNLSMSPPVELTKAVTEEMERLYEVGYASSIDEIKKHHHIRNEVPLIENNEELSDSEEKEKEYRSGLIKTRQRARIASEHVTNEVTREVEKQNLLGASTPLTLQRKAELAANAALKNEALTNAAATINAGRRDAALAVIGAITLKKATAEQEIIPGLPSIIQKEELLKTTPEVKGIYSSLLDERTCGPCSVADDGVERDIEDPALTVPNPECDGGSFCRCINIYVLSGGQETGIEG